MEVGCIRLADAKIGLAGCSLAHMSIEQSGNGDVSISCVASQSVYGGKKQLLTVADISAGKRDKPHRMAVIVNNLQRKLALDCRLLREQAHLAKSILTANPPSSASATLTLTSNFHVKVLNAKYALLRKPTDVLSFRLSDTSPRSPSVFDEHHLRALRNAPYLDPSTGDLITPSIADNGDTLDIPDELGSIFLAVPYCQRIARNRCMSIHEYLLLATVHGMAHLVGHVHNTRAARTEMKAAEVEVLDALRDTYGFTDNLEAARHAGKPFMPRSYLP